MDEVILKKIQDLYNEFFKKIPIKIAETEQQWQKLLQKFDSQIFGDFHRFVHSFCEVSGTYGYDDLCKNTRNLEVYLKQLLDISIINENQKKDINELILKVKNSSLHSSFLEKNHSDTTFLTKPQLKITCINLDHKVSIKIEKNLPKQQYSFDSIKQEDCMQIDSDNKTDFLIVSLENLSSMSLSWIANYKKSNNILLIIIGDLENILERISAVRVGADLFLDKFCDPSEIVDLVLQRSIFQENYRFKVFVLDDTELLAKYYGLLIEDAGMEAFVETDPLKFLHSLKNFEPDIIVIDLYMPSFNGLELAAVLRQTQKYFSIPIIFISIEQDSMTQMHVLTVGGGDIFLTKPILPETLIQTIKLRLKRSVIQNWQIKKDGLTGLYSHAYILEILEHELARAFRQTTSVSLVMMDVDCFKQINDSYGHMTGDFVLKEIAAFLKRRLRKTDILGRYGGDEFCIILPNTDLEIAKALCHELSDKIKKMSFKKNKNEIKVTLSIGVSAFPQIKTANLLLNKADEALYCAKNKGRNQVCALF